MKFYRNKGQALVETAIVMPVILLLIMGMIDFGLTFNSYIVIMSAAREGARSAAVGGTDTEINNLVKKMTSTLDQNKITINISPIESLRKQGENVDITIVYQNKFLTPIIAAIYPDALNLESKTTMRVE